jgi:hypothetical protein
LYLRFLSRGKQINELLNGVVSLVVSGFDFARWFRGVLWTVVKQAVGQRAAGALVEENERGRGEISRRVFEARHTAVWFDSDEEGHPECAAIFGVSAALSAGRWLE